MSAINIPLSRYLGRKIKKFWNLTALAKRFNLSLTKQESLRDQLIGLDSINRKLLLVKKEKDQAVCRVVDLQDLQHCSIKKVYSSIQAGDLQTKGLNHYLQSISLQLGFKTAAEPIAVHFYENGYNTVRQQSLLEAAAKKWEGIVSDLLMR